MLIVVPLGGVTPSFLGFPNGRDLFWLRLACPYCGIYDQVGSFVALPRRLTLPAKRFIGHPLRLCIAKTLGGSSEAV